MTQATITPNPVAVELRAFLSERTYHFVFVSDLTLQDIDTLSSEELGQRLKSNGVMGLELKNALRMVGEDAAQIEEHARLLFAAWAKAMGVTNSLPWSNLGEEKKGWVAVAKAARGLR